jgi:hypothetical protein
MYIAKAPTAALAANWTAEDWMRLFMDYLAF